MSEPLPASQMAPPGVTEQISFRQRLLELALLFTRLGFTAFGGPAAHIALIENEVVARRQWLDREHFLDIVAAINFVPGPNSTELAIHLGQLRAGFAGMLVAGACFITPAVLIILPIAWLYVIYGTLPEVQPVLRGISAAIVAIVAMATLRFLRVAVKDAFTAGLCAIVTLVAGAAMLYGRIQPEVPALVFAAVCGALWYGPARPVLPLLSLAPAYPIVIALPAEYVRMALFFLKVGATLFGSGYVLVSYLQSGLVDFYGWLDQRQLLDGIAVGQFTPGPLLTTATFVGYVIGHTTFDGGVGGGIAGALVATVAIFLPSFVFVALFGPLLNRIRTNRFARGALNGMNAAVVALMIVVTIRLAGVALMGESLDRTDWVSAVIALGAVAALWININSSWIVLGAGLIGWAAG